MDLLDNIETGESHNDITPTLRMIICQTLNVDESELPKEYWQIIYNIAKAMSLLDEDAKT